jgi:hypothetical protein
MEVQRAAIVLSLCDRWNKLPSEVMAEDAEMLYLLNIEQRAGLREQRGEVNPDGQ